MTMNSYNQKQTKIVTKKKPTKKKAKAVSERQWQPIVTEDKQLTTNDINDDNQ